ncbi:hypothetical protein CEXT_747371 [Caerostris extrusa]|uniref:Uncharacterized protein n=1 Tax=Caerostris extrusa TaxID=172846 RepID=A0AAV4S5U8_CAEEX|nr:hypothetical protein CEXT_747371 [Caerostris extrusa]
MRSVQVQLCKTEDAMRKTWIARKDANGCRFHHPPPPMDSSHPFPISVRDTNEEPGGRFWRSMPQDVLIHSWKTLFLHVVEVRPHSRPAICNIFFAAVLLMIWFWNRNEGREKKWQEVY